jgi:hypothetical protein
MIDISSIFSSNEIKQKMSNIPYSSENEKCGILDHLFILQSRLENCKHNESLNYLKFVDELIFQINDLDKSLTGDIKNTLNNIVQYINNPKK